MGEGELDFKFLPAGGQFHLRGSDEALTPYGGLVAWDHFLERCGLITELAANYPLPRYGKQEDTAIGYNPQKPGRPSHHPLACVIGGTRLCLHMEWRKGNTIYKGI